MKKLLIALALFGFSAAAQAAEWAIPDMNKTIEQTNFIVADRCSGTLISLEKKLILTNYHCVDHLVDVVERDVENDEGFIKKVKQKKYGDVAVAQFSYDGFEKTRSTSYIGEIRAENKKLDLAIVQLKGDVASTYASPLAAKIPQRGERIYTVGNPALWEASVFEGVVSNVNRTFEFPWTGGEKSPMIQFSGGVIGGNSGGALYNAQGELVGVPSAGAGVVLGLAIPVTTVKKFLSQNCLMTADDVKCLADKKAKKDKKEE